MPLPARLGVLFGSVLAALLVLAIPVAAEPNTPGQEATDALFLLVLIPAIAIGVLVQALLIVAIVRFRKRRGHDTPPVNPKTHDPKLEATWTIVPALILLIVGVATFQALTITDTIPADPDVVVTITGRRFFWSFSVDDGSGTLVNTTREFTVKVGQVVKIVLRSEDVVHAFSIPGFRLNIDVFPGRDNVYWFQALNAGDFDIKCREFCGINHWAMVGTLHVVPA